LAQDAFWPCQESHAAAAHMSSWGWAGQWSSCDGGWEAGRDDGSWASQSHQGWAADRLAAWPDAGGAGRGRRRAGRRPAAVPRSAGVAAHGLALGGAAAVGSGGSSASGSVALDPAALSRLRFVFCPDPGPGAFTAAFDAGPSGGRCFGSVNAGSGRSLRVGGTGLNGQFGRDLAAAGQPVPAFQRLHEGLMRLACTSPGCLVEAPPALLSGHRGVVAACARVADSDGRGFVAVDVLQEEFRPLHPANVAMVYCVGPDRRQCGSDEEFLAILEQLAEGLALACGGYSSLAAAAAPKLPPLHRVRVGLVSGGKYAGRVPKALVARSLVLGVARGAEGQDTEYEFAYDEGVFEQVWHGMFAEARAQHLGPAASIPSQDAGSANS